MWFIRYEVKYIIPDKEEVITTTESGIVLAHNYTEAAQILEDFYDDDLLEILLLRYIEETPLILSKETLDKIEMEINNI